jgi:hypothetical protein
MQLQGQVGPQVVSDGVPAVARLNKDASIAVVESHARYAEGAYRGNVYVCSNPAGTPVTTQAGLSATTPALVLYNPVGSGKLLVLQTVMVNLVAAPAAACHFMLAMNLPSAAAPTTVTLANSQNARTDSAASGSGQSYRISTLAAVPVAIRYFGHVTAAASITPGQLIDHVDGEIIIGPGVALSLQTSSAASVVAAFTYEEISL